MKPKALIVSGKNITVLLLVCQTSFSCDDLASLKAPLDIPIPDPAKEEAKRKKKEEVNPALNGGSQDYKICLK